MLPVGFELQIYALDRAATGIGPISLECILILSFRLRVRISNSLLAADIQAKSLLACLHVCCPPCVPHAVLVIFH
jgi:hypothetical protein